MLETAKLYLLSLQTFVLKKRPSAKLKNRVSHLFVFGVRDLANPYSLVFKQRSSTDKKRKVSHQSHGLIVGA